MENNFSVFVNSCDSFEDCWIPFFILYRKYWENKQVPLFLNTEIKDFFFDGLNIIATKVQGRNSDKLTWSECLLSGLDKIKTPIVLYLQDDYFIDMDVDYQFISDSVDYMLQNPDIGMISLTSFGSHGPYLEYSSNVNYLLIQKDAKYRISTQAALWRVETLRSYIEPEENGWMFEIFGTRRSRYRNDIFLVANFNSRPDKIISYLHTGIIKGKWLPEIQNIFRNNNILIDYSIRGFYVPVNRMHSKTILLLRLCKNPTIFLNFLKEINDKYKKFFSSKTK